jgi:hypothetical protein
LKAIPKLQGLSGGKLKDIPELRSCVYRKVGPEDIALLTTEALKVVGECCADQPLISLCAQGILECQTYYEGEHDLSREEKREITSFCSGYCSEAEKRPDWCPGLPPPIIAIIVIATVVVVVAIESLVIYRCVKKKRAAQLNQLIS